MKMKSKIAASCYAKSHRYVTSNSDCFRILGFSLNRDHNRLDSRVRRIRNRRGVLRNVHQKCMGFPRPIPQPEKRLFPSCGGPLRGAVKSETKSEIRRSNAHMCNSHEDTYASTVRIQFIYISPSTDIPLERSLSWFYRSISCRCVSPAAFLLFPPSRSPVLFFFWLGLRKTTPVECTLGVRNCARARRRFSQIRFFNANVTLRPARRFHQIILNGFSLCENGFTLL